MSDRSPWQYSQRSLSRLNTCHADLVLLMVEALADPECPSDITILEGYRNKERQNQMVAEGKSQLTWPKSKHNSSPSMAVDVAPYIDGSVSWDWDHYYPLAAHIKAVWSRLTQGTNLTLAHELEWGGDWRFKDGPHWQLNVREA